MTPEAIQKKLKELLSELQALDMSLTDEVLNHSVDYVLVGLCLVEAECSLNEALRLVEERNRRMN